MSTYGQPVGSLATQVAGLERQLDEYRANTNDAMRAKLVAVAGLHLMAHGPEDMNWCWTCMTNYPCPTRQAMGE